MVLYLSKMMETIFVLMLLEKKFKKLYKLREQSSMYGCKVKEVFKIKS